MSGGILFGPSAWDPVAIIGQIVALQCLYYLSLGLFYKLIVGEPVGAALKAQAAQCRRRQQTDRRCHRRVAVTCLFSICSLLPACSAICAHPHAVSLLRLALGQLQQLSGVDGLHRRPHKCPRGSHLPAPHRECPSRACGDQSRRLLVMLACSVGFRRTSKKAQLWLVHGALSLSPSATCVIGSPTTCACFALPPSPPPSFPCLPAGAASQEVPGLCGDHPAHPLGGGVVLQRLPAACSLVSGGPPGGPATADTNALVYAAQRCLLPSVSDKVASAPQIVPCCSAHLRRLGLPYVALLASPWMRWPLLDWPC